MTITVNGGIQVTNGAIFNRDPTSLIAALSPKIWLKYDDAYNSGSLWASGYGWTNSGSASVSPNVYGGNVAGVAGLVQGSTKACVNVGSGDGGTTTATFTSRYTPDVNTTYYNQTITINMTIKTNSDFRSNDVSGNWLWHQGASAVGGNQGLSVNYLPQPGNNDQIYVQYFTGGWRVEWMANATGPEGAPTTILQNNTIYNITFVYSSTGGTSSLGYAKFYINGVAQTTANLSYAVPDTAYNGFFGARGLSNTSVEYAARIAMDNCLLWNRELSLQEIQAISSLSVG